MCVAHKSSIKGNCLYLNTAVFAQFTHQIVHPGFIVLSLHPHCSRFFRRDSGMNVLTDVWISYWRNPREDGRDARSPRVPDRILSQTSNSSWTSSTSLGNYVHQLQLCIISGFLGQWAQFFCVVACHPSHSTLDSFVQALDSFQIGFHWFDGSDL